MTFLLVSIVSVRFDFKMKILLNLDLAKNAIRVGEKLKPSAIVNGTVMSLDDLVMTSLKGMKQRSCYI